MDPIAEIRELVRLAEDGKTAEARDLLYSRWQDGAQRSDPLVECVLAHHLADLEDDPREELRWDLLSLAAAESVTDVRASGSVSGGRLGLYPSIHLNLAEDYLKLGDRDAARQSVLAAGEHLHLLPDDSYGRRIRAGFERLDALLTSTGQ